MKLINKLTAIAKLVPGAEVSMQGDTIVWLKPTKAPVTEQQILEEISRQELEYENNEYQRLRAVEYPSIQEQMDMQYWDSVNGTTTWQDAINAVKAKYPKPEGV